MPAKIPLQTHLFNFLSASGTNFRDNVLSRHGFTNINVLAQKQNLAATIAGTNAENHVVFAQPSKLGGPALEESLRYARATGENVAFYIVDDGSAAGVEYAAEPGVVEVVTEGSIESLKSSGYFEKIVENPRTGTYGIPEVLLVADHNGPYRDTIQAFVEESHNGNVPDAANHARVDTVKEEYPLLALAPQDSGITTALVNIDMPGVDRQVEEIIQNFGGIPVFAMTDQIHKGGNDPTISQPLKNMGYAGLLSAQTVITGEVLAEIAGGNRILQTLAKYAH